MFKRIVQYASIILVISLLTLLFSSCNKPTIKGITNGKVINKDLLLDTEEKNEYVLWNFEKGNTNSKIISKMVFNINDKLRDIPIYLGLDSPNGTKATVIIGNNGYNLIILSSKLLDSAFDEFDELKDGYYIQASIFDFDKDANNEIALAIGNKSTELGIGIFKYVDNNFKQIGYIQGQSQAFITKDGIIEMYDNLGKLLSKYKWNGKEFVQQ